MLSNQRYVHFLSIGFVVFVVAGGLSLPQVSSGALGSRLTLAAGRPHISGITPFIEGWLPGSFSRIAHKITIHDMRWVTTTGKSGKISVTEGIAYFPKSRSKQEIMIAAARSSQYPNGYWKTFTESSIYKHSMVNGRLVIFAKSRDNVVIA